MLNKKQPIPKGKFSRTSRMTLSELRNLTERKEETHNACYRWGKNLRMRLHLAFGRTSPQANAFPSKDFQTTVYNESTMMRVMEILINLSNELKTELATVGQTPEIRAQGPELSEAFREAALAHRQKMAEMRQATLQELSEL